ncbi:MAG: aldo/keto reductase [Acidobacteria bacterium]|nr:MAG: aldo/keto reductase [Acidobacteriota bacterium]
MKRDKVSRREFLEKTAIASAAAAALPALGASPRAAEAAAGTIPHRTLGRTGASVSILAMGCGSRFLMYSADEASGVLEKALALGINYFDTAMDYGDGESEVPTRARTRDTALREVEASLKRLRTDHVDILHLHSLGKEEDLAKIEAADGALKALYELREQKVARAIGMTSHTDGPTMAKAIEHNDIDCVQMAMNPARALRFEEMALPAANKKNLGVILMKVTAQEKLLGAGGADPGALLRYAWSLPVSAVVCGMPKVAFIEANVASARAFAPMPATEMDELRSRLAGKQAVLEQFFADHLDHGTA